MGEEEVNHLVKEMDWLKVGYLNYEDFVYLLLPKWFQLVSHLLGICEFQDSNYERINIFDRGAVNNSE